MRARIIDASHATGSARCAATESANPIEWRPAFRLAEVAWRHQKNFRGSERRRNCRCGDGRRDARRRGREIHPARKKHDGTFVIRRRVVVVAVPVGVQCAVRGGTRGENRQAKHQTRAASRYEPTKSVGREQASEKEHGRNLYVGMIARRVKSNCVLFGLVHRDEPQRPLVHARSHKRK